MNRFYRIIAGALLVSILGMFTACSVRSKETPKEQKKYLIATDTSFAPFVFQEEDGKYTGIDVELLKAIAKDQGFAYELQKIGFNDSVEALESRKVDGVIAGLSITGVRKEVFDFSDPYFESGTALGVKADNQDINSYEDLKGKKAAVVNNSVSSDFAETAQDKYGFEIISCESYAEAAESVLRGDADACFEDYAALGSEIAENAELRVVVKEKNTSAYAFAVHKGDNEELLEMFNQGLKNIMENGTYQEIIDKYIQETTDPENADTKNADTKNTDTKNADAEDSDMETTASVDKEQ